MHRKLLLLLFCITAHVSAVESFKAVTIVPVTNLAFQRLAPLYPNKNLLSCYHHMALEGTKGSARSCPRAHQLLFNAQVDVIEQNGDEILVRIPNCYYSTSDAPHIKNNEYWAHKSDFLPLAHLQKAGLDIKLIPPAIRFDQSMDSINDGIATLLLPYEDTESGRIFSAGTRFVLASPVDKQNNTLEVWAFNPTPYTFTKLAIPQSICITHYPRTNELMRTAFVQLLRLWAQAEADSFIPYVWGGCSFTLLYTNDMITKAADLNPKSTSAVALKQKKMLATGFDCSGVILCAAQLLTIPYFLKNSLTALNNLKHISLYNDLAIGDLIYIQGHVMVVADLKNNTLIEARSHYHGFGRLQEIKLSKEFKGIETYQQLLTACVHGQTLERLDIHGKVIAQISDAQVLKFPIG